MKIVEKKNGHSTDSTEFKFDNGAWVSIYNGGDTGYGSWEYQEDEDDEETYSEGGLWFDGKTIEDYDGCYELPEEVQIALKELGYTLDE